MKKFELLFNKPGLRELIKEKMEEKGISISSICEDAKADGIKGINPSSFSRFFSTIEGKMDGSFTQAALIYILFKIGILVKIEFQPQEWSSESTSKIAYHFAKEVQKIENENVHRYKKRIYKLGGRMENKEQSNTGQK